MMRALMQWVSVYFLAYVFAISSAVTAALHAIQTSSGAYAVWVGVPLALASLGGSHGLGWASYLRRTSGIMAAGLAVVGAILCLFVTLWGGLGMFAAKSDVVSGERAQAAIRVALDRGKLKRLQEERDPLKARAAGAVTAEMANVRATPAYKASDGCEPEKITAQRTREVCERYRALEGELVTAREITRLDAAITAIEERLRDAPPEVNLDPQASAFAAITGLSVEKSKALYAFCASIALELMAAVAMIRAQAQMAELRKLELAKVNRSNEWTDTSHGKAQAALQPAANEQQAETKLRLAPPVRQAPPKPKEVSKPPLVFGSVKGFLGSSMAPAHGERVSVKAVRERYLDWCRSIKASPAAVDRFCADLEKVCEGLGAKIEHDGSLAYCVGVRLSDAA